MLQSAGIRKHGKNERGTPERKSEKPRLHLLFREAKRRGIPVWILNKQELLTTDKAPWLAYRQPMLIQK
jgi:hypothetical protein